MEDTVTKAERSGSFEPQNTGTTLTSVNFRRGSPEGFADLRLSVCHGSETEKVPIQSFSQIKFKQAIVFLCSLQREKIIPMVINKNNRITYLKYFPIIIVNEASFLQPFNKNVLEHLTY